MTDDFYHSGNRHWQDAFETRPLADRVNELIMQPRLGEEEKAFIESRNMFFLSTVDDKGQPTVSYKGGARGFVRVIDEGSLVFPLYDGNGMFLSAGNIELNPRVGLLFIDFEEPHRLRLHGQASVRADDPLLSDYHEAQLLVRIAVDNVFINCPRYIHPATSGEESIYVPREDRPTPQPEWKSWEVVADVLPPDTPTNSGDKE